MLVPNVNRVIIKPIPIKELTTSGLLIAGQLKAGENLFYGEVVHPGTTKFKVGQKVFYSEYSAASLIDARALVEGTKSFTQVSAEGWVIVAEDDIMAMETDDDTKVPTTTKKD